MVLFNREVEHVTDCQVSVLHITNPTQMCVDMLVLFFSLN